MLLPIRTKFSLPAMVPPKVATGVGFAPVKAEMRLTVLAPVLVMVPAPPAMPLAEAIEEWVAEVEPGASVLPLVMPGIMASFLICFTISLDEFIIAYFLGGTDTVLSVYIYGQFRFPAKVPAIMALGTILVLLSIALLATAEYFRRRGIAKAGGKDTGGFL